MAGLSLNHIYKVYPNGTKAVNDFTMEIEDKQFVVFVGPSGCGKSTTLRMIAGLEEISAGELRIGGQVVNDVDPVKRDTAMVFQNYALYPHFTVYQNIAFPLKMSKMPREEIKKRVTEAAEMLGLTEYLDVKPGDMSGGQRQRVALGRALVREPKVMLLDEPLSNLDAKLRTQMRSEITKLHKRLQTTFIYVTHDQTEAMTMGEVIVVMRDGFVQQIDNPFNLYRYPKNKFVAGFIGTPPMNFFNVRVTGSVGGDTAKIVFDRGAETEVNRRDMLKLPKAFLDGAEITLGVRPEDIAVTDEGGMECEVVTYEILGSDALLYCESEGVSESFVIKAPGSTPIREGWKIRFAPDFSKAHFFDVGTEKCLTPEIPSEDCLKVAVEGGMMKIGEVSDALPPEIDIPDGEYTVSFPVDSVREGKYAGTRASHGEKSGDKTLARIDAGGEGFWALLPDAPDGETTFGFDCKALTFVSGGEIVKSALDVVNRVDGTFVKRRRKEKNDAGLKFDVVFSCSLGDFMLSQTAVKRILSASDRKMFGVTMCMHFVTRDVTDGEISASVKKILDYGAEKFAVCDAGGSELILPFDGRADTVSFGIDTEGVAFYEKDADIRIV